MADTSYSLLNDARDRANAYYARQFPTPAATQTAPNGAIPPVQTRLLGAPTHMAPVQTRLLGQVQKTDMSAPSAMRRSDRAAGNEYQRATMMLHRLSRTGPLAQQADASMAAVGFRRNANNQGFNPVGLTSHEGEARATASRIQARQQTAADTRLLTNNDRLLASRYVGNQGATQAGNGFAPVSTAGLKPMSTTPVQTQQEADFNSLTEAPVPGAQPDAGSKTFDQNETEVQYDLDGMPQQDGNTPGIGDSLLSKKRYRRQNYGLFT